MITKKISVSFGENVVFRDFEFTIGENEITCILGPSGSGKSTLLKAFSGLIKQDLPPEKCSVVFQDQRLLPQLTVLDNIAVVLGGKKIERRERALSLLSDMELLSAKALYPKELSGGMAQRVAIARALAFDAPFLLMDEPFKGLDLALQERLINYFIKYWERSRRTTVFITHSILEAILIADRILVLAKGENGAEIVFDREFDMPRKERALGNVRVDALRSDLHSVLSSL